MQQEHEQFNRRSFLRLGGAGALVAGTKTIFLSQFLAQEKPIQLTDGTTPVNSVRLRSSEMEVVLDRNGGMPFMFHLSENNRTLRGEDCGKGVSVTACQKTPWKFLELETSPTNVKETRSAVDFRFEANSDSVKVASFTLHYELNKATVTIKLDDVKESQ